MGQGAPSNFPPSPSTAQLFPPSLLISGHSIGSGLFYKVLYTNETPNHTSHPIYMHWVKATLQPKNVQWEKMGRGGAGTCHTGPLPTLKFRDTGQSPQAEPKVASSEEDEVPGDLVLVLRSL